MSSCWAFSVCCAIILVVSEWFFVKEFPVDVLDVGLMDGTYEHPYYVDAVSIPSLSSSDERISGSWVKCDTEALIRLMEAGHVVSLPGIDSGILDHVDAYDDSDVFLLDSLVGFYGMDASEIESIEYVGEEEVQCIEVEDSEHMYLTDDWTPTCNTSNIVFLKSTDDTMIETLEKMSGKTHVATPDSKMLTIDKSKLALQIDNRTSVTVSTKETPVIAYNDLAFIPERNSIVFRAGNSVMWNREQTILPMSWRLFNKSNKIVHPGHNYTLQTIPTLSSAIEFDVRKNQPDFEKLLAKRLYQAALAPECMEEYQRLFGYNDYEIEQLDPDTYADQIMGLVADKYAAAVGARSGEDNVDASMGGAIPKSEENTEQLRTTRDIQSKYAKNDRRLFAGGHLSPNELVQFDEHGRASGVIHTVHVLDEPICRIYREHKEAFARDRRHFVISPDGSLCGTGGEVFIDCMTESAAKREADARRMNEYAKDPNARVVMPEGTAVDIKTMKVTDRFYIYLATMQSWKSLAGGVLEDGLRQELTT